MNKKRIAIRATDSIETILCSAPLVEALRKKNPDHEIGLISKNVFKETSALLPRLDFFHSEDTEESYQFIYDLGADLWDQVYSENADWKAYLQALSVLTQGNPYHKIDLLKKVASADIVDVNYELQVDSNLETDVSEALAVGGSSLKIAICVSSLSPELVKETVRALENISFPCAIYFIGTIKDRKTSAELAQSCSKTAIDLCGRISTIGMAQITKATDLVICGPGQSALLSSGFGTFTICYDAKPELGPIYYPYGHGHLIFQPHSNNAENFDAYSSLLKDCIDHAVLGCGGSVPSLEQWQEYIDTKIEQYLGKIRVIGTQRVELVLNEETSFTELHLRPLLFMGAEYFEVMQTFYRMLWEHSINERTITTNDLEVLHQDTVNSLCQLLKPLEQMFEIANFGNRYSEYIHASLSANNLEKAKADSERLQEVEELLQKLGTDFESLRPLCAFHERRQALLPEQNPVMLAAEMSQLFNDLKARILVMLDLEKTLFNTTFATESPAQDSVKEEVKF